MNKKLNAVMLQAFIMLEETPIASRPNSGICNSIMFFEALWEFSAIEVQNALYDIFRAWPDYSGYQTWPVGTAYRYWTEMDHKTLWHNSERIDLLDFCIFYCAMNVEV